MRTDGSSPEASRPQCKKLLFLCKAEVWRFNSWLTDTASSGTNSRLTVDSRNVRDKMEIDKHTRWSRLEDDEKATSGIPDCPCVLPIGRRFCCRRLMPGDLASKAAARVTSFLAS